MNVKSLQEFLSQFDPEHEVVVFMQGDDRLNYVECFAEPSGEPDIGPYPMIVVNYEKEAICLECGANIQGEDAPEIISRAHKRTCSFNPNYRTP